MSMYDKISKGIKLQHKEIKEERKSATSEKNTPQKTKTKQKGAKTNGRTR